MATFPDERDLPGERRFERYALAQRIHTVAPDLKAEEVALLKQLIGKTYSPIVVGPMFQILDPACLLADGPDGSQPAMDISGLHPAEVAVRASRRALAFAYLKGQGLEIGAGDRPVLIPSWASCFYGDTRDAAALEAYFGAGSGTKSPIPTHLDAQTLDGVADDSLDFVISAHVIEHLPNALGSIRNTIRVLKPGGVFMLVVPDKRYTFDRDCPVTPLQHFLDDAEDGGASTLLQSYIEHERYVRPTFTTPLAEHEIEPSARRLLTENADVHRHYWTTDSLQEMILHEAKTWPISLLALVPVMNENIAIIQRNP